MSDMSDKTTTDAYSAVANLSFLLITLFTEKQAKAIYISAAGNPPKSMSPKIRLCGPMAKEASFE